MAFTRHAAFLSVFVTAVSPFARAQTAPPTSESAPASDAPADAPPEGGEATTPLGCAEAYEKAQMDRANGSYLSALEQTMVCSQLSCSSAIVRECIKLNEALQQEVPTLVLSAKNPDGQTLVDVRVLLGDKVLLERLEGKPVRLDPGTYTFRFESEGYPVVETQQIARVGDRNRLIEVMLGTPKQAAPTAATTAPVMMVRKRPVPLGTYILAGGGVLALGTAGYLRLSGISDYNEYNKECSPNCTDDQVAGIRTKFQLSYIAIGVGAAALGGALAVYLTRGEEQYSPTTEVGLFTAPGQASATFRAKF